MSFERSIKMLILSVTFMGGALLTPILTGSADAQAAGPHLRVFDGGYVAMTSSADQEDEEIGEVTVDEEGDTQGKMPSPAINRNTSTFQSAAISF